ncbi:MAG: CpXC domain-containing protein [Anaerolineaceae bacterium]|nr:CpXC domain-containing protein [Anaerolineaceae bacterium]
MSKTSVPCPNCRQPVLLDLTRLFDLNSDPQAKEALLSGSANFIQCPNCRYQGVYPTPIVYHDPENELLLTYFPPELNTPITEQEKTIGPLIKKVMDDLPPEKRKGYLFRPQTMLTRQRLLETILEADGITPEMMKAQQEKLLLLQQLVNLSPESLPEQIAQYDEKIDEELFVLLSRLAQASAAAGDQESVHALSNLQQALLQHSTIGKAAALEASETQAAMKELQELSKTGITRENLLDLLIKNAESEIRLTTIASMARGGLDYTFFQTLTDKIDNANGEEKTKLTTLREKLLTVVEAVDNAIQEQIKESKNLLQEILTAEDIEKATEEALPKINQAFTEVINTEAAKAQEANDTEKLTKLATIVSVLRSASSSGAVLQVIEEMLQLDSSEDRQKVLEAASDAINDEFSQTLSSLINQVESQGEQAELLEKLKVINREVLRFTMRRNLNNGAK